MRISLPMSVTLLCMASGSAQADVEPEFQIWTAAFVTTQQTEPGLSLWLDTHARRSGEGVVAIVRPGAGYRLGPEWVLHGGYGWIPTIPDGGGTVHEHQLWQQGIWTPVVEGPGGIIARLRLEERFSDRASGVALRLRAFGRFGYDVGQTPLVVVLWDEFIVNFNDATWGPHLGFDENRVFAGVGLKGASIFRMEIGYLNIITRRPAIDDRLQNNLALNLFVAL